MEKNRVMTSDQTAKYPIQPVPQSTYKEFKNYLREIFEDNKPNTPEGSGIDYWLSDPVLNKLHYQY